MKPLSQPGEATGVTRAYFEERAGAWDEMMPPDLADALRRLLDPYVPLLRRATRVLEIGTGTGALIPHLAAHVDLARLVSVDLAHAMLAQARSRCTGAQTVQADVHNLPFAPGGGASGFSLVICHNSFPHYADKPRALAEFHQALQPGGKLLILHNLPRVKVNATHHRVGGPIASHRLPPADVMRRMLRQAGFDAVRVFDGTDRYTAQATRP
jgi:ubiquinone/menaquinone biosynthesis C-methylase UbiE